MVESGTAHVQQTEAINLGPQLVDKRETEKPSLPLFLRGIVSVQKESAGRPHLLKFQNGDLTTIIQSDGKKPNQAKLTESYPRWEGSISKLMEWDFTHVNGQTESEKTHRKQLEQNVGKYGRRVAQSLGIQGMDFYSSARKDEGAAEKKQKEQDETANAVGLGVIGTLEQHSRRRASAVVTALVAGSMLLNSILPGKEVKADQTISDPDQTITALQPAISPDGKIQGESCYYGGLLDEQLPTGSQNFPRVQRSINEPAASGDFSYESTGGNNETSTLYQEGQWGIPQDATKAWLEIRVKAKTEEVGNLTVFDKLKFIIRNNQGKVSENQVGSNLSPEEWNLFYRYLTSGELSSLLGEDFSFSAVAENDSSYPTKFSADKMGVAYCVRDAEPTVTPTANPTSTPTRRPTSTPTATPPRAISTPTPTRMPDEPTSSPTPQPYDLEVDRLEYIPPSSVVEAASAGVEGVGLCFEEIPVEDLSSAIFQQLQKQKWPPDPEIPQDLFIPYVLSGTETDENPPALCQVLPIPDTISIPTNDGRAILIQYDNSAPGGVKFLITTQPTNEIPGVTVTDDRQRRLFGDTLRLGPFPQETQRDENGEFAKGVLWMWGIKNIGLLTDAANEALNTALVIAETLAKPGIVFHGINPNLEFYAMQGEEKVSPLMQCKRYDPFSARILWVTANAKDGGRGVDVRVALQFLEPDGKGRFVPDSYLETCMGTAGSYVMLGGQRWLKIDDLWKYVAPEYKGAIDSVNDALKGHHTPGLNIQPPVPETVPVFMEAIKAGAIGGAAAVALELLMRANPATAPAMLLFGLISEQQPEIIQGAINAVPDQREDIGPVPLEK